MLYFRSGLQAGRGLPALMRRGYTVLGGSGSTTKKATATTSATTQPAPPTTTAAKTTTANDKEAIGRASAEIWKTFDDTPSFVDGNGENWATSFSGLGTSPFSKEVASILTAETNPDDVEITPDGLLYLPEIRYRRILNKAFGPGGWGLAPRSQTVITPKTVSREYGLVCHGRLVAVARGEQQYFDPNGVPTAIEGCKSNAMMRCCKDLGIASELWDPRFIRQFKKKYCDEKYFEKKRRMVWKRKDTPWEYPYK